MSFIKRGFLHKSRLMSEEVEASPEIKMKNFFNERTKKHIKLVREFISRASEAYPQYANLLAKRGEEHDSSKFRPPEYEPYVHLTWKYKCKGEGKDYEMDEDMESRCRDMTHKHCKENKHHPEYWDTTLNTNPISSEDRDKPSGIVVSAVKMDRPSIIEMVCDWCAVSKERNPANKFGPKEWADANIGKRWSFTKQQEEFIYEILENIWDDEEIEESYMREINESFVEEIIQFCETAEIDELREKHNKLLRMFHQAAPKEKAFLRKALTSIQNKINKASMNSSQRISWNSSYEIVPDYGDKDEDEDREYKDKKKYRSGYVMDPDVYYRNRNIKNSIVFIYFSRAKDKKRQLVWSDKFGDTHGELFSDLAEEKNINFKKLLSPKAFKMYVDDLWDSRGNLIVNRKDAVDKLYDAVLGKLEDEIIIGRTDGEGFASIWNEGFLKKPTQKKKFDLDEMVELLNERVPEHQNNPIRLVFVPDTPK